MVSFIIEKGEEINTSLKYYQKNGGTNFLEEKNISLKIISLNHVSLFQENGKRLYYTPLRLRGSNYF